MINSLTDQQQKAFHLSVRNRHRRAFGLSALVVFSYCIYVYIVAFAPDVFRIPINNTGSITLGIVAAVTLIISYVGIAALYTWRANIANSKRAAVEEEVSVDE